MEQNELFVSLLLKIKEIESQLSLSDDLTTKNVEAAEKKIEDHFEKCVKALAMRKAAMLRELAQRASIQNESFKDAKKKIKKAGEACKQIAHTALMTFPVNAALAENICMEALSIPTLLQFSTEINLTFPEDLLANIGTYGKITGLDVSVVHAGDVSFDYPTRFSVASTITTIAGSSKWGKKDGKGVDATFNFPMGMCLNPLDDCLYVCDSQHYSIRTVSLQGDVNTLTQGQTLVPMFKDTPLGIAIDLNGKVFIITTQRQVQMISLDGKKRTTLAGPTYKDDAGRNVMLNVLQDIAVNQQTGHIFVCDVSNNAIQEMLSQGEISTLAGSNNKGFMDRRGKAALFSEPCGICYDYHTNSLLVCDNGNNKIRRVQLNGDVSTLCEVPVPRSIAITSNKTILVSSDSHRIYKVVKKGQNYDVSILAGSGKADSVDGKPNECSFNRPWGIVVHEPTHSCFVVDYGGHKIRKISFTLTKQ